MSDVPVEDLAPDERFMLAGRPDLPVATRLALAGTPDWSELLIHHDLEPEVLAEILTQHPEARADVAVHPNADLELMETAPLDQLIQPALERYAGRRGLTGERESAFRSGAEAARGRGLTLGEFWREFSES
ncbi:hypothetical protein [Luteipulveratus mongoliensis]|uniref:variant leucine-rich repeat-containing protein n=1 Tax=Luteipulveratus mongoliensis TaxID=571913 RepID=UPI0012ED1F65|nr:hypothetical protein [Luteipulveratus mongoliensis]